MFFSLFGKKGGQVALDLQPGHEVELEVSDGAQKEVFVTEVIRLEPKTILLSLPHGLESLNKFKSERQVVVHVELEEKIASFPASVSPSGDGQALVLRQPSKVEWKERSQQASQRRNFVRFSTALPLVFSPAYGVERQATTLDISGNGVSMVIDFDLSVGKEIPLRLRLPDRDIKGTGKVVRCQPYAKEGDAKGKYDVGVTFTKIEPKDQDLIVKYIFGRQRDLRRRGLM